MGTFSAIIEIAILYCVIYTILKGAKGSRFGQALMGVGVLIAMSAIFTYLFHFHVLSLLIKYLLIYFSISSVVIFQPEIRRFLATIGALGNKERNKTADGSTALTPKSFIETILQLSERKIGALFAFECAISLRGYEETATEIDAVITPELIITIFTPPLPLHDGGAVIRNGRLSSAHCLFPVSHNPDLAGCGMRHRAAVGISEETDTIAVAVSEETGSVSIAHNGKIHKYSGEAIAPALGRWMQKAIPNAKENRGFIQDKIESFQKIFKVGKGTHLP